MNIFYHRHDDSDGFFHDDHHDHDHHDHHHEGDSCCASEVIVEEDSCGCCSTKSNSKNAKSDNSFFSKYNEAITVLIKLVLMAVAYFAVGEIVQQYGHAAAGLIHDHSYEEFSFETIHIGNFDLPIVLLYLIPYLIIGYDILWHSIKNISKGQVFDENFLMSIATIGALILGEYGESIAVMVFYQIGEMFQEVAVKRSKRSITELMDIRPDYANIEQEGSLVKISPQLVQIGQIITVMPGEKIPLDGTLIEGESSLDTSALTGEAFPRLVKVGDEILSGCVNQTGVLKIEVTKLFGESTVSKILKLVQHASAKKAHVERFITRFAKYYTPVVVIGAVLLAVLPPLVLGANWMEWIQRALILLVISCPCALVISVPLGFFAGIGASSKHGILIKGGNYLEALSRLEKAVFDKTGTLTRGIFTVVGVHVVPHTCGTGDEAKELELLETTALAERYSNHPISLSIKNEYFAKTRSNVLDTKFESRVKDVEEKAGNGVIAMVDGKKVAVGNTRFMEDLGVIWDKCSEFGTIIHVAIDGQYAGHIVIADEAKPESKHALEGLKKLGVKDIAMLTGDSKETGEHIGKELGIDHVYAELLPQDKVSHVESMLEELKKQGKKRGTLSFVGDGINDAPVLALADIGIAMGALGSDAAIEASDIVLMDDNPAKLTLAVGIARRTLSIVIQNIVLALGIKGVVMILGAMGIANMWMAIFADTGVALLAVLNSMRALQVKNS